MDFEQTNNSVENTPELESQEVIQETVETPVEAAPEKSGNAAFAQFADKAKDLAKELAKDERVAKGVEKAIAEYGAIGVLCGGLTATAAGITAAIAFGLLMSVFFKSGDKS